MKRKKISKNGNLDSLRFCNDLGAEDQPMEEEKAIIPSPSPVKLAQPFAVGLDNKTSAPKISPPSRRQTRSNSRLAGYVISSVLEPPTDDDSEPEGSPQNQRGPIATKDRAALSLAKGPASKGPPKTADRSRGQLTVAVCVHTSAHVAGVAGNQRIQ